ncbi:MAG: SulP family inorganic anion transporter [Anaerotruncus sp.]|nr:SulP family inorganic anion transporter [Anaerotruncus sp.]
MGYAAASGLPAIYGLYATIVPLIAYAIFGPSRILVLGPDSALAALIAATILPLAAGNADKAVALAGMLAILSGMLCILAGLARFGFITDLLSKPIRDGYLNGIALTVLIGQLPKVLGFSVSGSNFLKETSGLMQGIWNGQINGMACVIGILLPDGDSRVQAVGVQNSGRIDCCRRRNDPGFFVGFIHQGGNRRDRPIAAGLASIPNSSRFLGGIRQLVCCRRVRLRWCRLPI